jgi:hypothetical protein
MEQVLVRECKQLTWQAATARDALSRLQQALKGNELHLSDDLDVLRLALLAHQVGETLQ